MNRKIIAAVASAVLSLGIALSVGLPIATAQESGGGQCNNYGDRNIIVAPFCGAGSVPPPATTVTEIRTVTRAPDACAAVIPRPPGCPGYDPPIIYPPLDPIPLN